jgi:hypothetical protein
MCQFWVRFFQIRTTKSHAGEQAPARIFGISWSLFSSCCDSVVVAELNIINGFLGWTLI